MRHILLSNSLPPSVMQITPIAASTDSTNPKAAVSVGAAPAEKAAHLKEDTAAKEITTSVALPSPLPTSPIAATAGTGTGTSALTPAASATLTLPVKDQPVLSKASEPFANTVPLQFGSVGAVLPLLPPLEAMTSPSSSSSFATADATNLANMPLFNKKRITVSNFTGTSTAPAHTSDVAEGDRWLGHQALAGPDPTALSASVVLEQSERLLKKLLKVLHVCARYQMCTGKTLPPTIDYFGQTLLGMTSIR